MKEIYLVCDAGDYADIDDLHVFLADGMDQLQQKMIDKLYDKDFENYIEFVSLAEFLDDVKNREIDVFKNLVMGDMEQFKKDVFEHVFLKDYEMKSYTYDPNKKYYLVCDEEDMDDWKNDVHIVSAKNKDEARQKGIKFATEKSYKKAYFCEHLVDKSIDGLGGFFWNLNGECVFNLSIYDDGKAYADHVYAKYRFMTDEQILEQLEQQFKKNAAYFFQDRVEYYNEFVDYFFSDDEEHDFSDNFHYYCFHRLCEIDEPWIGIHVAELRVRP